MSIFLDDSFLKTEYELNFHFPHIPTTYTTTTTTTIIIIIIILMQLCLHFQYSTSVALFLQICIFWKHVS